MADHDWYHGEMSRTDAERLLELEGKDGAFLVRKSDRLPGGYVLSLLHNGQSHHFRIKLDGEGYCLTVRAQESNSSFKFSSLQDLISYLRENCKRMNIPYPPIHPICPERPSEDEEEEVEDDETEDEASSDETEEDETIRKCPPDLRKTLRKRGTTYMNDNSITALSRSAFGALDTSEMEEHSPEFLKLMKRYVIDTSAFYKDIQLDDGEGMRCIQQLLEFSSLNLMEELRLYRKRLAFIDNFLSSLVRESNLSGEPEFRPEPAEEIMDLTGTALQDCAQTAQHISGKVTGVYKQISRSIKVNEECLITSTKEFEAKEGNRGRTRLVVDPMRGSILLGKGTEFYHQQIQRMEKSHKDPTRMTIVLTRGKNRDIIFDDTRTREEFFQTVSQIKHIHKSETAVKSLSVYCCTWNMGEVEPADDTIHLLNESGPHVQGTSSDATTPHDILAFATQEANLTERDWTNAIKRSLSEKHPGVSYMCVASQSLMGIRVMVLARSDHKNKISCTESGTVKTGVGGMVGNKGAAAISFTFGTTTLAFVSCHLAARAERKLKRTEMYRDICQSLNIGKKSKFASFDFSYRFDHVFWMGDLNYRLDCEYQEVLKRVCEGNYPALLRHDQLISEQRQGRILYQYVEAPIKFQPTYRYKRGERTEYVYVKHKASGNVYNVPSYCDRILLHSLPQLTHRQTGYFANMFYRASDHAPVIATYHIATKVQCLSARGGMDTDEQDVLKIRFPVIEARIKVKTPDRFCIKFFSAILEEPLRSKPHPRIRYDYAPELEGYEVQQSLANCEVACWEQGDIPELIPILSNREYIANECIFIQVVSHNSDECYGQGILPMQDKCSAEEEGLSTFHLLLTLNDEKCGEMRGQLLVSRQPPKEARSFVDQISNPVGYINHHAVDRHHGGGGGLVSPGCRSVGSSSRSDTSDMQ